MGSVDYDLDSIVWQPTMHYLGDTLSVVHVPVQRIFGTHNFVIIVPAIILAHVASFTNMVYLHSQHG